MPEHVDVMLLLICMAKGGNPCLVSAVIQLLCVLETQHSFTKTVLFRESVREARFRSLRVQQEQRLPLIRVLPKFGIKLLIPSIPLELVDCLFGFVLHNKSQWDVFLHFLWCFSNSLFCKGKIESNQNIIHSNHKVSAKQINAWFRKKGFCFLRGFCTLSN